MAYVAEAKMFNNNKKNYIHIILYCLTVVGIMINDNHQKCAF